MKERPILFSGAMVRAILAGTKTQTRRVLKPQPQPCGDGVLRPLITDCPHGYIGDRLWVREAWARRLDEDHLSARDIPAPNRWAWYWASGPGKCCNTGCAGAAGRVRAARFMPRWASRILLEIAGIRVERVQEITEDDALREGCYGAISARNEFTELWDSINEKRGFGWETNPWVWVISFRTAK